MSGQTRPERWPGPARANQTGQADSTTPTPKPMASAWAAWGVRRRSPAGSVTRAAATNAMMQSTTTTTTMASSCGREEELGEDEEAEQKAGAHGAVTLADQDLVEDGHHEREQHEGRPVIRWANSRLVSTKGEKP